MRCGLARLRRTVVLAVAASSVVGLFLVPASATDQGHIGTITEGVVLEKEYPPIPGQYPHRQAPRFFTFTRPTGCREQNGVYCDTITFEVKKPKNYGEIFEVHVILTWGRPEENDVDLAVWGDDDTCCLGGPIATGQGDRPPTNNEDGTPGNDGFHPETAKLSEPEDGMFWVTVINDTGVNLGYTLQLVWKVVQLPPLPDFSPPGGGRGFSPPPTVGAGGTGDGFGLGDGGIEPSPTTIKVPGPDGQMVERKLDVYLQAQSGDETGGFNPLIPITVAIVLLGAALGGFFFLRSRNKDEQPGYY